MINNPCEIRVNTSYYDVYTIESGFASAITIEPSSEESIQDLCPDGSEYSTSGTRIMIVEVTDTNTSTDVTDS